MEQNNNVAFLAKRCLTSAKHRAPHIVVLLGEIVAVVASNEMKEIGSI